MQGHDGRWTLHKVQQCSWAWIHVDTLNFTTNGQGKNSSAWKSHWERTSRYPFWGRGPGKTGSWLRPPTRACPKEQEKIPPTDRAVWFSSAIFFSRKWVGEFLSEPELVRKKEQKNKNAVFFRLFCLHSQGGLHKESDSPLHDAIDSVVATENASNPSWVKHRRMQRCVVATPLFFLFHYPLVCLCVNCIVTNILPNILTHMLVQWLLRLPLRRIPHRKSHSWKRGFRYSRW